MVFHHSTWTGHNSVFQPEHCLYTIFCEGMLLLFFLQIFKSFVVLYTIPTPLHLDTLLLLLHTVNTACNFRT